MTRQYLRLAMRHFHLEDRIANNWQDMFYNKGYHSDFAHLGEGIYNINTSNFKWPSGVSYQEMMESRCDVQAGVIR